MKKNKFLLVCLVSVLALTSCKKKKDDYTKFVENVNNSISEVTYVESNYNIDDSGVEVYRAKKSISKITNENDQYSGEASTEEYKLNSSFKLEKNNKVENFSGISKSILFAYNLDKDTFTKYDLTTDGFEATVSKDNVSKFFNVNDLAVDDDIVVKISLTDNKITSFETSYKQGTKTITIKVAYTY